MSLQKRLYYLRGKVKKLQAENKELKREIARLEKLLDVRIREILLEDKKEE